MRILPQRLKPRFALSDNGTTEVVPLQNGPPFWARGRAR